MSRNWSSLLLIPSGLLLWPSRGEAFRAADSLAHSGRAPQGHREGSLQSLHAAVWRSARKRQVFDWSCCSIQKFTLKVIILEPSLMAALRSFISWFNTHLVTFKNLLTTALAFADVWFWCVCLGCSLTFSDIWPLTKCIGKSWHLSFFLKFCYFFGSFSGRNSFQSKASALMRLKMWKRKLWVSVSVAVYP